MTRYADAPMSFADACLVHLAETEPGTILTLDSGFRTFRIDRRNPLDLVMP